jgi:hypothetical protein|tara:strand:- start:6551 stop:8209 length:1659 start_codon:yes stop_codon:yes gene_type:complete
MKQSEAMTLLLQNRRLFMETLLEVENKERMSVPFQFNAITADMEATSTLRDIYVKPSQVWATTYHMADFLIDNITKSGTVSTIISYDEFIAGRILLKAKRFHASLNKKMPSIPQLDHKSSYELTFVNKDTNFFSSFYIYSSRSYTIGRGETIHNLLEDEIAFWAPGAYEDVAASAEQRVPLLPGTKVRKLSTANGEDNPFCEEYRSARSGKALGRSVYKPHFYPWYIHYEYSMKPDSPFCLPGDEVHPLSDIQADEAALLIKLQQLGFDEFESHCKLRWRRYKKIETAGLRTAGKSILVFEQEYPEDDESCFQVAGDQAYNPDIVREKLLNCYPAPIQRNIVNSKTGIGVTANIWEDKQEGLAYILSIDPGKGKVSESVAQVWRFTDGYTDNEGRDIPAEFIHCATLAGYYDEWEMAEYCKELGRYYNEAVICPEDNLDIVSHLKDYPELYYREDPRSGTVGRVVGWQTNVSTKPYMITEMNRHLDLLSSHDQRFWAQLRNIRRDRGVRSGITVVGPDDHHDAGAIAIVCRGAAQVHRGYVGSAGWSDDWGR